MQLYQSCPSSQDALGLGSPIPRSPAGQWPRASPRPRRAHGSRQHRDPGGMPTACRDRPVSAGRGARSACEPGTGREERTSRHGGPRPGESPQGQCLEPTRVPDGPDGSPSTLGALPGALTPLARDRSVAGPRGSAWQGSKAGADGRASQASCASGDGQLEGVENQPFPPPEGAPEDSSATGRRHSASARGGSGVLGGNAEKQSRLSFGGWGRGQGREKQPARTLKAQKQVENDQFSFP